MSGYIKLAVDQVWLLSTGPVARVIDCMYALAQDRCLTDLHPTLKKAADTNILDLTSCDAATREALLALLPEGIAAARREHENYDRHLDRLSEMLRAAR